MVGTVLRVRYELTSLLRENPVFRTFAAFDKIQSREVSIRILSDPYSNDGVLLESLRETLKKLSAVRHPNVESLIELDSDDETPFIVGELTKGSSIADRLKKLATLSVPATVEVGIAACEGLQALHRALLCHGDLGGATVVMQPDGEIKLQDAGLWMAIAENPSAREGLLHANCGYNAPEVSKGGLPTPASDVYSLGILLFQLVTGRLPYEGESPLSMAIQHATEPTPSAKDSNPSVPQALDHILQKAMAKATADRYPNATDLLSDLRMQQDALRFGKAMSWPMKAAVVTGDRSEPATNGKEAHRPVKPAAKPKASKERDVPIFLTLAAVFLLGAMVVGGVLFIISNVQRPPDVQVPQLSNMSYAEAQKVLEKVGLHLRQQRLVASETVPAGAILTTTPAPGAVVFQGDQIRAVVSSGSKFVEVPDLRGMSIQDAQAALLKAGLKLGSTQKVTDRRVAPGMVVSQVQAAGTKYERGTAIQLSVSSDSSHASQQGDEETRFVYTINDRLRDITTPITLRVDMTDARGTRTICNETHQPGDLVTLTASAYGDTATFRFFYNGSLIEQKTVNANELPQTPEASTNQ